MDVSIRMLDLLADGWSLRVGPATRDAGNALLELPALFAVWQPAQWFNSPARRHEIRAEAQATVAEALTRLPAPTVLIDGAHTVWAAWRLEEPLDLVQQRHQAEHLQRALAGVVDGDASIGTMLHALLPFAGVIRSWNVRAPEWIRILAAPERHYRIKDLVQIGEETT